MPAFYFYCWINTDKKATKCQLDVEQSKESILKNLHNYRQLEPTYQLDVSDYGFIILLTLLVIAGTAYCCWRTISSFEPRRQGRPEDPERGPVASPRTPPRYL